jgi:hypothetical protein
MRQRAFAQHEVSLVLGSSRSAALFDPAVGAAPELFCRYEVVVRCSSMAPSDTCGMPFCMT